MGFSLAVMLGLLIWGFSNWNLRYYQQYIGDRLELLVELRQRALEEYFATAEAELRFWSANQPLVEAMVTMHGIWNAPGSKVAADARRLYVTDNPNPPGYLLNLNNAEDGSAYSQLHERVHAGARQFITRRNYYDFFLIGPEGDVYYSVEKESDFTTNLVDGPWQDSALAQVFKAAKGGAQGKVVATSDMQRYEPSAGEPAIFMGIAMHNVDDEFIGVLALQLPTDRILGIMTYTSGMGDSGETYLVGEDLLMRSNSRFAAESTILDQKVDTPTVKLALDGEQGRAVINDYRGVEVLSAYTPIDVGATRWAVMAEIDQAEIVAFAATQRPALSGALALIYGLALWTIWYWRGRRLPDESQPADLADMSFDSGDGHAMSD